LVACGGKASHDQEYGDLLEQRKEGGGKDERYERTQGGETSTEAAWIDSRERPHLSSLLSSECFHRRKSNLLFIADEYWREEKK